MEHNFDQLFRRFESMNASSQVLNVVADAEFNFVHVGVACTTLSLRSSLSSLLSLLCCPPARLEDESYLLGPYGAAG
eukprot:824330-Amphidinium_carterae.1